jgi:hypothetical protein
VNQKAKDSPAAKPASPKSKKVKTANSVKSGFFKDVLSQAVFRLSVANEDLWSLYERARKDADKAPAIAQAWLAANDQLRIAAGQYDRLFLEADGQEAEE